MSSKPRASDRLGVIPPKPLTTKRTRSNALTTMSKEDIIDQPYEVKDSPTGKTYLEEQLFVPIGEPYDQNLLASTLLHITQLPHVTKPAIEAIRAVAFILMDSHGSEIAESIANKLIVAISPKLATLHKATTDLESTVDKHKQSTAEAATALNQICNSANDIANKISSNPAPLQPHLPPSDRSDRPYSDALKTGTGNSIKVHEALRRTEVRSRQILLTPSSDNALFTEKDTNSSIAQKLQSAIDASREDGDLPTSVKSVLLLHNNGILFEVNSSQAAEWVRQPNTKVKLLGHLDLQAVIKDRLFSIIVPYVPISFKIEEAAALNALESDNDLPQDSIVAARWIKPSHRRSPEQRTAYAIFSFSSPDYANTLIRDGLILKKEKLHPRKDKKEPVRCVRCQKWGHIARTCKAQKDTCGTCGNAHRTDACNNTSNIFCVNCTSGNHPSHSRNCPEFVARCEHFNGNNPENQMPYFPTDALWTQALLPPKGAIYTRQQPAYQARNPTFRQTTLDIDKLGVTKPPTQHAQKNMYPARNQPSTNESRDGNQSSQMNPIPRPLPNRTHLPTPTPRTPDESFHSTSSNNEIDCLILNYDTTNE